MIQRDMVEVLEIEENQSSYAWTELEFFQALRQRNCIGQVATQNNFGGTYTEQVLGFMIYELQKRALEIIALGVHPSFRRRRVGTQFVDKLKGKLNPERRREIVATVRETNLDVQLFLRSQGFQATKVLRRFYTDDSGEDAFEMRYSVA
jgi:ribosomal-protein-alanine N-acetyltransferase